MIEFLTSAWNLALAIFNGAPLGMWTLLLAFLGSALLTQRAKFWLPIEWTPRTRAAVSQALAFWTAVAITWALWPVRIGLIAGACVGIASPTLYAVSVRLIGIRWPSLRDVLSQDTRD